MVMWHFWLILAGLCLIIEMATIGFLVFWVAIGALIAMLLSFFVSSIVLQIIIFIISSTVLMLLTRPLVNKYINKETIPTNINSIIGKTGIVVQEINSVKNIGQVKVDGEIWSAKSNDSTIIEVGTEVKVLKVDGVKLEVTRRFTYINNVIIYIY